MARAVRFHEYGGLDVLQVDEVDEPAAEPGRVVVEVVVAGINPGEIAIREGAFAEQWHTSFPSGQGTDFAGRVHAIGDGVHGWRPGDEVIGWTDERGAQADFVSVPSDQGSSPSGTPGARSC
jgi:NADPH:quinone reductase-like Zn-dependent oxidoreductase